MTFDAHSKKIKVEAERCYIFFVTFVNRTLKRHAYAKCIASRSGNARITYPTTCSDGC